jgi:NTE family protein
VQVLRDYWLSAPVTPAPPRGMLRHTFNWMSAFQARLVGSPRHLRLGGWGSFYDLGPTVDFLRRRIDFGRLNDGPVRLTVGTVDIESGDPVYFDTRRDRLEVDHILASCGFLPEFAPVELSGRLLGDGGLAANAPIEPVLDEAEGWDGTVVVVDLFARDGPRPHTLEAMMERKNALLFGNQTWLRLDLYRRFWGRQGIRAPRIVYLSYRLLPDEAGPEAAFDFSRASAEDRWREGSLDMEAAAVELDGLAPNLLTVVRRRNGRRETAPQDGRPQRRRAAGV